VGNRVVLREPFLQRFAELEKGEEAREKSAKRDGREKPWDRPGNTLVTKKLVKGKGGKKGGGKGNIRNLRGQSGKI